MIKSEEYKFFVKKGYINKYGKIRVLNRWRSLIFEEL